MTSISGQAQAALTSLYTMAGKTSDNFNLERIDRALDEVLRLNSDQPADQQVRNAMAHALQVIRNRREKARRIALDLVPPEVGARDSQEVVVTDILSWLRGTTRVTNQQRRLLALITDTDDAATVAAIDGIPPDLTRQRISRARRGAAAAYHDEVTAA
jgi:hypothetical protein